MPIPTILAILGLAGCFLALTPTAAAEAADDRPPSAADPAEAIGETMLAIREVARGMSLWLAERGRTASPPTGREREGRQALRWDRCPSIGHEELERLLIPRYLAELPREDAWGQPLEYCLDRWERSRDRYLMGVRSPGPDGEFEGDRYRMAPFGAEAAAFDLVWMDGFFVTWPGATGD